MKIDEDLQRLYQLKTEAVARCLVPLDELDESAMREIVRRYTAAVEPNFIPWVGAGVISARSVQGRFAASENLEEELRGDHQGMLRDFAERIGCTPNAEDYCAVQPAVQRTRDQVREMNGLKNIALLAYLENTSGAFIPYLAGIAKKLGNGKENLIYTDAHGEADIEHARQFLWALGHEKKTGYGHPDQTIREGIIAGGLFLRDVLGLRAQAD